MMRIETGEGESEDRTWGREEDWEYCAMSPCVRGVEVEQECY